jgi:hypothetical protein
MLGAWTEVYPKYCTRFWEAYLWYEKYQSFYVNLIRIILRNHHQNWVFGLNLAGFAPIMDEFNRWIILIFSSGNSFIGCIIIHKYCWIRIRIEFLYNVIE